MSEALFVKNHRDLLALYRRSRSNLEQEDVDQLINDLSHLGQAIAQSHCSLTVSTYNRYVDLLQIRLGVPHVQEQLKLHELLPPIKGAGLPGISVVTCAMNRTQNLLRALPTWLRVPEVREVIIVDWSSKEPVRPSLLESGVDDSRIKVVRVNDEPRWILSYAFNVGFRCTSHAAILKTDADILLSEDFFERNGLPAKDTFIAGNYKIAKKGQEHINGFVFVPREALVRVAGFNEFITRYGWDDDDLYGRLVKAGYQRKDVVPESLYHIPHSDAQRTGHSDSDGSPTVRELMLSSTRYLIHCNRNICDLLPVWGRGVSHAPMLIQDQSPNDITLVRAPDDHAAIAPEVMEKASRTTLRELLVWDFGSSVWDLREGALDAVLARRTPTLMKLDIEVALADYTRLPKSSRNYLVFLPEAELLARTRDGEFAVRERGLDRMVRLASSQSLHCVVFHPEGTLPETAPSVLKELVCISRADALEGLTNVTMDDLVNGKIKVNAAMSLSVRSCEQLAGHPPVAVIPKRKLYIDAQHGLGNRLRAIGSAAAIAEAADMELVIVWESDVHCECQFTDLFEYDGPVVRQSFVRDAAARGIDLYNYMPIEEGAAKSAAIRLDGTSDVYVRSAFVLNSPHSNWTSENRFLHRLTPVEAVRQLVASVRQPCDLAAHVRMEAGAGRDDNDYDRPENWREEDHRLIHEWRAKSHYSNFINRIDALMKDGGVDRLFLAADLPETYDVFKERYGRRLVCLPRSLYDRSLEQLRYALADAIILSRTKLLLCSTWSSFSELAMRLAQEEIKVEMSGEDF